MTKHEGRGLRRPLILAIPFVLTAALMTGVAWAEPSIQLLADTCAVCHGTDGDSPGSIDELDDIELGEFVEEMKEFKYEAGEGRIMGPITRGLSDAQIQALAEHFQTLSR